MSDIPKVTAKEAWKLFEAMEQWLKDKCNWEKGSRLAIMKNYSPLPLDEFVQLTVQRHKELAAASKANYNDVDYARGIAQRVWGQLPFELLQSYQAEIEAGTGVDCMQEEFLDSVSKIILEAIQKLTGDTHAGICPRCGLAAEELRRLRRIFKSKIEVAVEGVAKRRKTAEDNFRRGVIPNDLGLTATKAGAKPDNFDILSALLYYIKKENCVDESEFELIRKMIESDRGLCVNGPGG